MDHFADRFLKIPQVANKKEEIRILHIVNKILGFNEQSQKGKGLKILTLIKMLSRWPISLAQLNTGNNFKKT